jgi:hypothetical protein
MSQMSALNFIPERLQGREYRCVNSLPFSKRNTVLKSTGVEKHPFHFLE